MKTKETFGVFAYASTQPTEASFGAPYLLVDPAATRYAHTGFTRPTYIYPGRLIPAASEDFLRMTGRLIDEMPQLRLVLREALGFKTGSASGSGGAAGSWRGCVVRLSQVRRESIGYEYGVILTEPRYSSQQRYQIIVPLDDLSEFEPGPGDVEIVEADWYKVLNPFLSGVLVAVPDIQSIFQPVECEPGVLTIIDEASMAEIESALMALFGL